MHTSKCSTLTGIVVEDMDRELFVKFDRVSRLYFWVPPVAVIVAMIIDGLIADGGAKKSTAFLVWIFSMSSILYYHSGLVANNWRSFKDDELQDRLDGLREMLHPGILLVVVGVHVVGIGLGLVVWGWILKVLR